MCKMKIYISLFILIILILLSSCSNNSILENFSEIYKEGFPPSPVNLRAKQNGFAIELSWNIDSKDDNIKYHVFRSSNERGTRTRITDLALSENNYIDYDVKADTSYWYWVKAYNNDGLGSNFSEGISILFKEEAYSFSKSLENGSGDVTIKDFGPDDFALVLIYSTNDEAHREWNVERLSTETSGEILEYPNIESHSLDKMMETQTLFNDRRNILSKSQHKYLLEKEAELYQNHDTINQSTSLLTASKKDPSLGDIDTFKVYNGWFGYNDISAQLKGIGDHSLVWIDESINISSDNINRMIDEFDRTIHPTLSSVFGRVPDAKTFPVLANNCDKINILITPLVAPSGQTWGIGQFNPNDLYSKENASNSNERKILYIHNHDNAEDAIDIQISTIAHEFQHMIFYNEKVLNDKPFFAANADIWINEGLSQLAEDLVGYGFLHGIIPHLNAYLSEPDKTSLINWEFKIANYDASYLFARYIYDRFGKEIISYIHNSNETYKDAIGSYAGTSFRELYEDWASALFFDRYVNIKESRYNFPSIEVPGVYGPRLYPGDSWENISVKGWSSIYTLIMPGNGSDLKISIEGADKEGDLRMKVYWGRF
ncbi:fibronectin type III domain-containing protein [Natronospora cellulosivora (SeqCode)]